MKPILTIAILMNFLFCSSQNYSDYIDLDKIETISHHKDLVILRIREVFLAQNNKQESLYITSLGSVLYKLSANGA